MDDLERKRYNTHLQQAHKDVRRSHVISTVILEMTIKLKEQEEKILKQAHLLAAKNHENHWVK
jgi:hypothetical protein